jgi:aspartate/methionine/tyrosine aminotransferase
MTEAARLGYRAGDPAWANLGQGAPETGPLPGAPERAAAVPLDPATNEYAPIAGIDELRSAVATLYNLRYRDGRPDYKAEHVAIAAGGRTALTRIATSLGEVNLGHLLPDYTAYEELLSAFRAFNPIPIRLRAEEGFQMPAERLEDEIVGLGLGALLLSNPCNPTGQDLRGEELRTWIATAHEFGCSLIFDEFYAHYRYGTGPESAARYVRDVDHDAVIIVDGLTKNWRYPGWRLSWTLAPPDVIERLASAGSFLDGGAPHPLQRAAIPLLDRGVADGEAEAIQAAFSAKRALMSERLDAMGFVVSPPPGAFYCFAALDELPDGLRDGMDFFRRALEHRVICVPGEFFDVDPGNRRRHIPSRLKRYVRLSFGPEWETVEAGLDRIEAMVRGQGRKEGLGAPTARPGRGRPRQRRWPPRRPWVRRPRSPAIRRRSRLPRPSRRGPQATRQAPRAARTGPRPRPSLSTAPGRRRPCRSYRRRKC